MEQSHRVAIIQVLIMILMIIFIVMCGKMKNQRPVIDYPAAMDSLNKALQEKNDSIETILIQRDSIKSLRDSVKIEYQERVRVVRLFDSAQAYRWFVSKYGKPMDSAKIDIIADLEKGEGCCKEVVLLEQELGLSDSVISLQKGVISITDRKFIICDSVFKDCRETLAAVEVKNKGLKKQRNILGITTLVLGILILLK